MDLTAEIKISENVLSLFGALYLGLSWPTITRQIQDPISMHTDHNFCAAVFL